MPHGTGRGTAHGDLTRVILAVGHETVEIGDAVLFGPFGVDGDGGGVGVDAADRDIVLIGIVGHILRQVGRDLPGDHADGVAVGIGIGDGLMADNAAGAGQVVDGDGLAKLLLKSGAEGAQAVIRAAAGAPGVDGVDALAGIVRGEGGRSHDGHGQHHDESQCQNLLTGFHLGPP